MATALTANIYSALFITLAAATITLVLRLFARILTRVQFGVDDCFVLIAYVRTEKAGLGKTLDQIDLSTNDALRASRMYLYFLELSYATSLAFSKFSILSFYWRLFSTSGIRLPIITLAVCSVLWLALRTFIAIFHCIPPQAFWENIQGATCSINDSEFFFWSVLAHLVLDICIIVLPILQIRKLQLRTHQKIGVASMFCFGIFVCVASIVVLVLSRQFDASNPELPFNVAGIMIWASVEVNLAVFSACLPMLRPIFKIALQRLGLSSGRSSRDQYNPSKPISFVKMRSVTVKSSKNGIADNDSTRELAAVERDATPLSEEDIHDQPHGIRTLISTGNMDPVEVGRTSPEDNMRAIFVKNETTVRSERVRQ
ncbi:hypothetical protein GQ53DRAFT_779365 [Thozetella sp. PMI_491]|nr:hypothetical protein GQ53DRAFT_779365 [Thozetella sp. PMI_491]